MITIKGGTMSAGDIRPDGIYKTGVIRATGHGYAPSADAYAVTERFSQADQLRGMRSGWARFKLWMRTSAMQRKAMQAGAAAPASAPNAIATNPSAPNSPGASLPPSTASPSYPGQSPDATQMSAMGLYISSGFHPSFVPSVVMGKAEKAAKLDPRLAGRPAMLAYQATNYADGRVGQAAWQSAVRRFYAMNKSRIG
jgi:hypothetical protein